MYTHKNIKLGFMYFLIHTLYSKKCITEKWEKQSKGPRKIHALNFLFSFIHFVLRFMVLCILFNKIFLWHSNCISKVLLRKALEKKNHLARITCSPERKIFLKQKSECWGGGEINKTYFSCLFPGRQWSYSCVSSKPNFYSKSHNLSRLWRKQHSAADLIWHC